MKFEDVLQSLRDGKKVRRASWAQPEHVSLRNHPEWSHRCWVNEVLSIDWEIVEENPYQEGTFQWAVWETDHGQECRRGERDEVLVRGGGTYQIRGRAEWNYELRSVHFFATDWRRA